MLRDDIDPLNLLVNTCVGKSVAVCICISGPGLRMQAGVFIVFLSQFNDEEMEICSLLKGYGRKLKVYGTVIWSIRSSKG